MTEDKTVISERENELIATIIECRKQLCEATMRIKTESAELAKLAPHKEGEIVTWVEKGKTKNVGNHWNPIYKQLPDKNIEAVLTNVEANIDTSRQHTRLSYTYTFKPIKKDGSVSQNQIYSYGKDIVWTGRIHKDFKTE